jgi:hypothetical protein
MTFDSERDLRRSGCGITWLSGEGIGGIGFLAITTAGAGIGGIGAVAAGIGI